jgi:serine/threonine protein kinase
MPLEIANTRQIKPDFGAAKIQTGAANPRELLHNLTVNVQNKQGSLKLMHSTDESKTMAFERKSWWQFGTRADTKMANTSKYVETLFLDSYQPLVDSMPEGADKTAKQDQLNQLIQNFQAHVAGKSNLFGKTTMRTFFNRAESEFVVEEHRSNIQANGDQVAFKPIPPEQDEFVLIQDDQQPKNEEILDHPALIPNQNQQQNVAENKLTFGPLQNEPQQFKAPSFAPEQLIQEQSPEQNVNENPIQLIAEPLIQEENPLQNNPNQSLLIDPQIRQIPEFQPTEASSRKKILKEILQGANSEMIGKGAFGQVYKVERPGQPATCLKLSIGEVSSVSLIPSDGNLRNFDASVIYMNSEKGLKIPHVARPTALIVMTIKNDKSLKYYRVPLENYRDAKQYLRKLAHENEYAVIRGSEMPMASGQELHKINLKSDQNAVHRQAIGKQLLEYVSESHKIGIIDRDHKPDNLIYDKGEKKLTKIDLGMQTKLSTNPRKDIISDVYCGTPDFMSTLKSGHYGPDADLFEAGMSLMEVKYGSEFLSFARSRFSALNRPGNYQKNLQITNGMESTTFRNYLNSPQNAKKSYLQCLVEYSRKNNTREQLAAQRILNDLKSGDAEAKFYEEIFQVATESRIVNDTTEGRKTVFKDYYQKLDDLMQNEWIQ